MLGMNVGVKKSGPGMANISKGIAALNGADVLVGIPEENASRKKGPINNAELLFIFTNGSPLHNQPPRVVIEAAVTASPASSNISKELAAASKCALDGDEKGMIDHLDRAGTIGESASKRWFTDPRNGWEPNALSTINRKLDKLSAKKREQAVDAIVAAGGDATGIITVGIMTGQMRRAITHIVQTGSGASARQSEEDAPDSNDGASALPEGAEDGAEATAVTGELGEVAEVAVI